MKLEISGLLEMKKYVIVDDDNENVMRFFRVIDCRVRQWVEEYAKARGVKNYVAGQV